jgi:putative nucleotidyltransferase with HDIG domain
VLELKIKKVRLIGGTMFKIRMRTDKLKSGMIIADEVYSIIGSLILPRNTVVDSKVIDLLYFHRIPIVTVIQENYDDKVIKPEETHLEKVRQSQAFKEFDKTFETVSHDLEGRINEIVYLDKDINIEELWNNLNALLTKTDNSIEFFHLLHSMKHTSDFTYIHSVNVALISNMLAKWLRYPQKEIELASIAGLLHDIGKTKLPPDILNKQELLTSAEITAFKRHPTLGYNILKEKNIDRKIQVTALTHHERCDASGYPLRLKSSEVCDISKIVAIADTYDELTANHVERKKVCPFRVIHMFESEGLHQFDTSFMLTFLGCILDTYVHSNVMLSNGQKGEIIFVNKAAPSRPIVKVGTQYIDLSINSNIDVECII